jgi:hypothetical protein
VIFKHVFSCKNFAKNEITEKIWVKDPPPPPVFTFFCFRYTIKTANLRLANNFLNPQQ